jgi:hypothetical protein
MSVIMLSVIRLTVIQYPSVIMLSVVLLNVCRYAGYPYAECHSTE